MVYLWHGDYDHYRATRWRPQAYLWNNYIRRLVAQMVVELRMRRVCYLVMMDEGRVTKRVEANEQRGYGEIGNCICEGKRYLR